MYTRLTKTTIIEGRECVSCIFYGTEMCRIHKGISDCGHCDVVAAILNQLHTLENILLDECQGIKAEK